MIKRRVKYVIKLNKLPSQGGYMKAFVTIIHAVISKLSEKDIIGQIFWRSEN